MYNFSTILVGSVLLAIAYIGGIWIISKVVEYWLDTLEQRKESKRKIDVKAEGETVVRLKSKSKGLKSRSITKKQLRKNK